MDVNKDGKVSRDEMPDGGARRMFDSIVEKHKLDPKKTYTLAELEQITGLGGGSPTSASSPSRSNGGPSSGGPSSSRFSNSRRGPSPSFSRTGGATPRAPSDGRPFRAIEELPEPYRSYDKDGDGQVGLYEWPRDRIREFIALDLNDDGFLTISELKGASGGGRDSTRDRPEERKEPPRDPADQ